MKKKVFIGSTGFDLKDPRAEISQALLNWGFEPKFYESPDFPVEKGLHSHDVCLDAVKECDIFVLIIGIRYGGLYEGKKYPEMGGLSITRAESRIAFNEGLEFRTFIRNNVWNERPTYKSNLEKNIKIDPFHVKDITVFDFIDEIVLRFHDNWIYQFEDSVDLKQKLKEMLVPESLASALNEIEEEDINIEIVLSEKNKRKILLQNGKQIPYLESKSSGGPAECIIYADIFSQFFEKSYYLEISLKNIIKIDDLKKIISCYYTFFKSHYVSAFGINQETRSWFGYGTLNFIEALEMQDFRYLQLRQNNEYIHHREAACFIDETKDSIFYLHFQPNRKDGEEDIITLDYVNIGFLFSKIPCCSVYNKFFKEIGQVPNVIEDVSQSITVFKKLNHSVEKEGILITNPDTMFGGWVSGIYCKNTNELNVTKIYNDRIIVNFGQQHEQEDECEYKILGVHATTLPARNFPAIIVNYKGNWEMNNF